MLDFETKVNKYGNHFVTSLKETSFDQNNKEYMTESSLTVYNFDKIKDEYVKTHSEIFNSKDISFRSNDALYCKNGSFIFIEFKNGEISKHIQEELRTKVVESLLILIDILEENLKFSRENCVYIFVYNKNKNSKLEDQRNSSKKGIANKVAKHIKIEHNIVPSFYRYNLFFKKVYTINNKELDKLLEELM